MGSWAAGKKTELEEKGGAGKRGVLPQYTYTERLRVLTRYVKDPDLNPSSFLQGLQATSPKTVPR